METAIFNTIRLRKRLKEIIRAVHEPSFYNQATDDAKYPYVTYEYTLKKSDDKRIGLLEINVWDLNIGTEAVEEIADKFENVLDGFIYTDAHMVLKFYINTRSPVIDEDKRIKRRMLVFEMQYYAGRE